MKDARQAPLRGSTPDDVWGEGTGLVFWVAAVHLQVAARDWECLVTLTFISFPPADRNLPFS